MTPLAWLRHLWTGILFATPAGVPTAVRWRSLLILLVLPAALLYPCMNFMLLEPDEARYAQIPKEMLEDGNWVVPTLHNEPYLDKPPLMYWLVALSYKLFGVSEASARLVPAVCVHLTVLAVYLLGRRSVGERAAFWASLLLGVAPGFLGIARLLVLDGLLTLCVTTSVLCGFEAVRTGTFKRGWWLAAAVCSGLGFLTKGPISEVLLFPPLVAFGWMHRDTGAAARIGWKDCLLFAAVVVGVNLPWYVAMGMKQPEFLRYFFWEHNVLRFVKPFDHLQPVWYYAPVLLLGFLPGVVVGVPYVRSLLRGDPTRTTAGGFWLLAGLWCVAFFSFSGSKLPTYILPAYPPLCLALGEYVSRTRWNQSWLTRGLVGTFALLLAGVHYVGLPWYAKERSPMGRPELVTEYIDDPTATVVTYPREISSVAFYTGRRDITPVRSKDANKLILESHFRPKTVVLFTHNHSLHGFKETIRGAVGCSVTVTNERDMNRKTGSKWLDNLLGGGPWGLCDIAVVEPPKAVPTPTPPTPAVAKTKPKPPFKADTDAAIADVELEAAFDESKTPLERDRLLDVARKRYESALQKEPTNRAALLGLAKLFAWTDDKPRAVAMYAEARKHYPQDAEVAFAVMRGMVRFADWSAAVAAAEVATKLDPESRVYRKALSACLLRAGRPAEAFDQALKVLPEPDARCFLARTLIVDGKVKEGREQLELVAKRFPDHSETKTILAELAMPKGDVVPVEAREPAKK
ncbi:MAG: glycosyltransferase family 39 protein [Fimbriiglobus sp.]|nr:glycosyltransferase family 39 protein [Fimbriiglobus sp.]